MSHPAISVENLSKAYRIGAKEESADTLVGALTNSLRYPLRNLRKLHELTSMREGDEADDILWALKDVSFEVQEGEVVGVIGRNGAGKSTLLKILSRITEPTGGRAVIRGRVSSLLEVGTGFHPELTGRENVYMNGTILGMTKREIDRKFDEIVDFSGVEKFLDTPTKRYSSGMQVRLAFAVAAHLEPEILIVDEVLAVGDAEFQKKCLGKMQDVARGGRTVLFVSHNMAAIESLCNQGLLISNASIRAKGRIQSVIDAYRSTLIESLSATSPLGNTKHLRSVAVNRGGQVATPVVSLGGELVIELEFDPAITLSNPRIAIGIDSMFGQRFLTLQTPVSRWTPHSSSGVQRLACQVSQCPLPPGDYTITVSIMEQNAVVERIEQASRFQVENSSLLGGGRGFSGGSCVAHATWEAVEASSHTSEAVHAG